MSIVAGHYTYNYMKKEEEEGNKGEKEVNLITNVGVQEPNRIMPSGTVVSKRH